MYCPKCRVEYEDWVKSCADCHVPLVENLSIEPDVQLIEVYRSNNTQDIDFIKAMLESEGIEVFVQGSGFLAMHAKETKLIVSQNDKERALDFIKNYLVGKKEADYNEYKDLKIVKKKAVLLGNYRMFLAGRLYRLAAVSIDNSISSIFLIYISIVQNNSIFLIAGIIGWVGLMIAQVVLLSIHGQTIGKRLVNIRIVKYETGETGGFATNVLIRLMINGFLSIIPFYRLCDILFIFREDRRCIHDLIAGTCVVER